jgi:hypothetical protein
LQKRHAIQFTKDPGDNKELLEASNYLEKIFQVAFHLKATNDDGVKHMIRSLAKNQALVVGTRTSNDKGVKALANDDGYDDNESYSSTDNDRQNFYKPEQVDPGPEALTLTEDEISFMEDLSEIVGSNPRAIKRFVNTYRIVKAHQAFDAEANTEQQTASVLLLLAIPLGNFKELLVPIDALASEHIANEPLSTYFLSPKIEPSAKELYQLLLTKLAGKKITHALLDLTCEIVARQFELTGRFTFRNA